MSEISKDLNTLSRRKLLQTVSLAAMGILLSTELDQGSKQHPAGASHTNLSIPSIPTHKTISDLCTYILQYPEHFPHRMIDILDTDYCELAEYDTTTQDLIRTMLVTCKPGSGLEESIISTMMGEYYDGDDVQLSHWSDLVHQTNLQMRKDGRLRPDQFIKIDMTNKGKDMINQGLLSHIDRDKELHITPPSPVILGTQYEAQNKILYTPGGVDKMYFNHAKALLDSYNIHTKSTAHGYKETGARSNSNETCLQGVNLTTIDGLIQLVTLLRRGNDDMIVTNRGMTELGHTPGTYSHANGYKVDIARLGISGLMFWLMIQEHCTPVPDKYNQRTLTISDHGCNYHYRIMYHAGHFDIVVKGSISDTRKHQILDEIKLLNNPPNIKSTLPSTKYMKFDRRRYMIPQTNIT